MVKRDANSKEKRIGLKSGRQSRKLPSQSCHSYIFVTDGTVTETEYITGLIESTRQRTGKTISVRFKKVDTDKLVKVCQDELVKSEDYNAQLWIVLDKDQVPDFDRKIKEAESLDRVHVAWSNPCLEIWFLCYINKMKFFQTSQQCCKEFGRFFKSKKGIDYDKSQHSLKGIYEFLNNPAHGNEQQAIKIARNHYNQHVQNHHDRVSKMNPCTTMYQLVEELRSIPDKQG